MVVIRKFHLKIFLESIVKYQVLYLTLIENTGYYKVSFRLDV